VISAFSQRQEKPPSAKPNAVAARVAQHRAAKQGKSVTGNDVTPSLHANGNDPVTTLEEKRTEEKRGEETAKPSTPPAVEAFREVREKYPAKEKWADIQATVGTKPADIEFWRKVLIAYAGQGWNRQSVDGPLDFYKRKEIPHKNSPYNQTPQPARKMRGPNE
jgi:hypothetical protein